MLRIAIVFGLAACAVPQPVGVYRLPIQTGPRSVELKTVVARLEEPSLVLLDVATGAEFGRGVVKRRWNGTAEPIVVRDQPFPVSLFLRDGVFQDALPRPWNTAPAPPIDLALDRVDRFELTHGASRLVLDRAGAELFGEVPQPQAAPDAVADVLDVLGSPAGAGLVLPTGDSAPATWRDAYSAAVPPDATREVPCAASIVSTYRNEGAERVSVPAGEFDTTRVSETIDSCLHAAPEQVRVYAIVRWFALGVGPVKVRYQASDARWRTYELVARDVPIGAASPWPLEQGATWTYRVIDPDGVVVSDAEVVRVDKAETVAFP